MRAFSFSFEDLASAWAFSFGDMVSGLAFSFLLGDAASGGTVSFPSGDLVSSTGETLISETILRRCKLPYIEDWSHFVGGFSPFSSGPLTFEAFSSPFEDLAHLQERY